MSELKVSDLPVMRDTIRQFHGELPKGWTLSTAFVAVLDLAIDLAEALAHVAICPSSPLLCPDCCNYADIVNEAINEPA